MWDHNLNYQENHERVKALCSLVEHEEWQDISTAPMDGTEILLLVEIGTSSVDMGYWIDYTFSWWYNHAFESGDNPPRGEWDTDLGMGEPKYWKHKPVKDEKK